MSEYNNPIDMFAAHPELVPLLDIARQWHDLFDMEEYSEAAKTLASLQSTALELLNSDKEEAKIWAGRAMGVSGLVRARIRGEY